MRNLIYIIPVLALLALTSCYNCVECTNCERTFTNADSLFVDSTICYRDAKDYYGSRGEWKDDVQAFEERYSCECQ